MDDKFLEFWGNFLIQMARGQKQTNEFFKMMQTGFGAAPGKQKTSFPGFDEMFAAWRKMYGIDQYADRTNEYVKVAERTFEEFLKTSREYFSMMGIVPKDEHLSLVEKYEKLKEKCNEQEETIKHLKMLLSAKGIAPKAITGQLEKMAKSQGEMFVKMMSDFNEYFNTPAKPGDKKSEAANGAKDAEVDYPAAAVVVDATADEGEDD